MATIEELQSQINSLSMTIESLSAQLDKRVLLGANKLIEDQTKFVKSIAVISGTFAPFSLFLLQADTRIVDVVNIKYLFTGFIVLMFNVLCIFAFLRWLLWIDYQRKVKFLKLRKVPNIQNSSNISKTDIDLTYKLMNKIAIQLSILTKLQSLFALVFEDEEGKKKVNLYIVVREAMIWVSLCLLLIGVALIVNSFLAIFFL